MDIISLELLESSIPHASSAFFFFFFLFLAVIIFQLLTHTKIREGFQNNLNIR